MHVFVTGATEADLPNRPLHANAKQPHALAERGVRAATVRLAPSVHGIGDHGFIPVVVRLALEEGVSAYPGDGQNCWSGVHRLDAARLYRLAPEEGASAAVYHAVADEAVSFKAIAETVGRRLGLPVEARDRNHFGWFANMAAADMAASSIRTRELLGGTPTHPGLLADLDQPEYYAACGAA